MKQAIENLLIKSSQILIVEDDRQQLVQMVGWLAEREGCIFQARSAEQAQAILAEQWVDAVITDWQLPERSGLDLIQDMRATGFKGPLLICTGMMLSPEHLKAAFEAGVDDYLRKPLNKIEFNTRLENCMQLYAHRQILGMYAHSQSRFIQFLSYQLGEGLEQISQTQAIIKQQEALSTEQKSVHSLTADLKVQFNKLMDWARFRFALHHVQFSRIEVKDLLKSMEDSLEKNSHRLMIRGGKDLFINSDS